MNWRYRVACILFAFTLVVITARLFYWQVVKAEELSLLGKAQYGSSVKLTPQRGEIITQDGFPIATNKFSYLAFVNPKEVKDPLKVVQVLSSRLGIETASVSSALGKNLFWVPIKSHIEEVVKNDIEKENLAGVGFEKQSIRFYPEASMAAQLIGFVGKNDLGEDSGYFGLEGYYDRQLKGKQGVAVQVHDAFGRPILSRINKNFDKIDGRTLTLTLDRVVQFLVETKLKKGIEEYGAEGGMAAVMDPKTGGILAMASFPSFDPSNYQLFPYEYYKNPFISNLFEPGSTFKSLVMAAGIDSGVVDPYTKCPICDKPVSIGGYDIKTWNDTYQNGINMIEVIQHSDNTGMVYVAKSLGLDRMYDYLKKFGIGESTDIDLYGEVVPFLRQKNKWYPIDLATASFGQGIHVTGIELLSSFSAIANEGIRVRPHVVSTIKTEDGNTFNIEPKMMGKPISSKTAKVMTEILVNAVNKGEAQWARVKGYRIAGKTGTAQIPIAGHYDPSKTIASFIGFAPADNPKFVMLVVIDKPTQSIYGAETAAPIFFNIARDLFSYYKIPPSE